MGITGLLPLLKNASFPTNVQEFNNCIAIIDTYCWLHRSAIYCAIQLYFNEDTDFLVNYCLGKVNSLKSMGIKCILVFDGLNLPSKYHTEHNRKINREKIKEKIRSLLDQNKKKDAYEYMKRCIDITWEMARKLIIACRQNNIDYIVAPYEADAQIAYLMKKKIGHFVITEDSDLLLFGCDYVFVKMDKNGDGIMIRSKKIKDCLGAKSENFNLEKFRRMCILSGCDYLPNLPGIGIKKARSFFSMTMIDNISKALLKLPSYLKMKNLKIDQEYISGFIRAENTFKYQLVYCPIQKKLLPLNPYVDDIDSMDLDYAGKMLDPEIADNLALGNLNLKTLEIIDDYKYTNFGPESMWSETYKITEANPLDIKYNIVPKIKKNLDSNKRISDESPPKPAKKIIIDENLIESYRKSDTHQETDLNVKPKKVVLSRHFSQSSEFASIDKSFDELILEKEKKRKFISSFCYRNSKQLVEQKIYDIDDSDESWDNSHTLNSQSSSFSDDTFPKSGSLTSCSQESQSEETRFEEKAEPRQNDDLKKASYLDFVVSLDKYSLKKPTSF